MSLTALPTLWLSLCVITSMSNPKRIVLSGALLYFGLHASPEWEERSGYAQYEYCNHNKNHWQNADVSLDIFQLPCIVLARACYPWWIPSAPCLKITHASKVSFNSFHASDWSRLIKRLIPYKYKGGKSYLLCPYQIISLLQSTTLLSTYSVTEITLLYSLIWHADACNLWPVAFMLDILLAGFFVESPTK